MKICGIDEAGRGPVIGPMVMCGLCIDEKDEQRLQNLGVRDSKLLSAAVRERLYRNLTENFKYKVIVVEPEEIDATLWSKKTNLNWLEADKSIEIINSLNPKKVFVDCPSQNIAKYTEYIQKMVKAKVIAEHHAEDKFLTVAAASIIAKVTRDNKIEGIKKKYNIEFGSGYPSDPATVEFLKKNYKKYPLFRKSWAPYQNVIKQKNQSKLNDF